MDTGIFSAKLAVCQPGKSVADVTAPTRSPIVTKRRFAEQEAILERRIAKLGKKPPGQTPGAPLGNAECWSKGDQAERA